MKFEELKASIVQLLGDNANGEFRVFGYQGAPAGASEFLKKNRAVRAFYKKGRFNRQSSSMQGPFDHQATFMLEFCATAQPEADVAALSNPASTPTEIAAALMGQKAAEDIADTSLDQMAGLVWNILMRADEQDLGLDDYQTNKARFIESIEKDQPVSNGQLAILTGFASLEVSFPEDVEGEIPKAMIPGGNATDIQINEDENQNTSIVSKD